MSDLAGVRGLKVQLVGPGVTADLLEDMVIQLPHIQQVWIRASAKLKSIAPLSRLEDLKSLTLLNCPSLRCGFMEELEGGLRIEDATITKLGVCNRDLSFVAQLPGLRELTIIDRGLDDLQWLRAREGIEPLEVLSLRACVKLEASELEWARSLMPGGRVDGPVESR